MADFKSWQVPPAEASEKQRLGWVDEATEDGLSWQRAQRAYRHWEKALEIISGDESCRDVLDYRSHISGRRLKTNVRVAASGLSNIRPIWGWHANKAYAAQATVMNKTAQSLYLQGYWDQDIKAVLLWSFATGVGFLRPVYRRDMAGRGKGSIQLDSYGAPCVCPVQLPANGDFQKAYAVTLLDEQPIWMAHGMFPLFQDQLKPTASRYWYSAEIRTAAQKNSRKKDNWFSRKRTDSSSELFIPIRYTTICDLALNTTGRTIPMGQPGSPWYYEVPSLGSEIPDSNGKPKRADENDARLYPYRRLMISTEKCLMYDGPSFNWHGELDLIPFYVDWWPWEPMGLNPIGDTWELQKALDEIDRGCMDKVRIDLDRPLAYNLDAVTSKEAKSFDPLEPRNRIGYDGSQVDRPFTSPVDESFFQISNTTLQVRELLQGELDYAFQTRELIELAKAKALSKGMDDVQALIAASGPLVKDMCRGMEKSLGIAGSQVGWLMLEYMGTPQMLQYVGMESMPPEVFDYDPESIVPSHMPGEDATDPVTQMAVPSQYTRLQRARFFAEQVRHFLLPHSAHEIAQMSFRLMLMQLKQRGIGISEATIMRACEVPDVEMPEGNSEQERFQAEQKDKLLFAVKMKELAESMGLDPAALAGGGGGGKHGGRPPSAHAAPKMETKDGGSRATVTESR
jgi:hypothetical protein